MRVPEDLREGCLGSPWITQRTAPRRLPEAPGAYVLLIRLGRRLSIELPRLGTPVLEPGWYAYCGSAHGPGGIRARVLRHMRKDKKVRWHVDRLTIAAREVRAATFLDRSECDLVARLLEAGFTVPVAGFGSTDCENCPAHLLRRPQIG